MDLLNDSRQFSQWWRVWVSHYRPQTKLRQGNVFIGVCLSTGGISGSVSLLWGGYLWYHVPSGGIQVSRGGHVQEVGTHPPPPGYMGQYEIWSTSGRYASCWNAFLFLKWFLWKQHATEPIEFIGFQKGPEVFFSFF